MSKNLKISYILLLIFSAIVVAFKSLSVVLFLAGLTFVALLSTLYVVMMIFLKDKEVFKRIKDCFFASCGLLLLESIVYFACEMGSGELLEGFHIYQNIVSIFGLLLLFYVGFRFTMDYLNKKICFIEFILGNKNKSPKVKKTKEISNGCLEEKPNQKFEEVQPNNPSLNEEVEIIVSEDEE